MSASPRCSLCNCCVVWVAQGWWSHIYDPTANLDHAPVVPDSPEADAAKAEAEANYLRYRESLRRRDQQRERAFESWRRGLEA